MADPKLFHQKIDEYLTISGRTQKELAEALHISESELSRRLNNPNLKETYVRAIVTHMAGLEAITTREQASDLLKIMDCRDFDQVDWGSEPLNKLKLGTHLDTELFRKTYLQRIIQHYELITLPIGRNISFFLEDVFQPLKMRQGSLPAEDLDYEERRAFLDENTRDEDDPRRAIQEHEELSRSEQKRKNPPITIVASGEEALEKSPEGRMIVIGSPGAGKTTLLKSLVRRAAQRAVANGAELIPLFISLPELAESSLSLQDYLPHMLGSLGIDLRYADVLWREIQRGHAFICLDGLDEVAPAARTTIIGWINHLASNSKNIWVIGSRFSEYKGGQFTQGKFTEWELQFLTPPLRRALAQKLLPELYKRFNSSNPVLNRTPSSFVKALEKHPRAAAWSKSPLLFSLAAIVFVHNGTLPSSRATLYREVIDAVLKTRLKDRAQRTTVRRTAAALALELQKQKRRTFTYETLHNLLPEIRRRHAENWSTEVLERELIDSGLFEVVAEGIYGFWHQTYQEYLSAVALAENLVSQDKTTQQEAWNLVQEKRTYSRWVEVLRLMVGVLIYENEYNKEGTPRALSWLHNLAAQRIQPEGDVGDLGLSLAVYSLSEIGEKATNWLMQWKKELWKQLEEDLAHTWVQALLDATERRHEVRQQRLLMLATDVIHFSSSTVSHVVSVLIDALLVRRASTRKVILQALGKLGKNAPIKVIIDALHDSHEDVRHAAVSALVERGEYTSNDVLLKALKDKRAMVREAATLTIGELRRSTLLKYLANGLDDDWTIRQATVQALGNMGKRAPMKQLARGLHDEEALVRLAAVEALGKLGERAPIDWLIAALDDSDELVRSKAIQILGERTPLDKLIAEIKINPAQIPYSDAYRAALKVLGLLIERLSPDGFVALIKSEGRAVQKAMEIIDINAFISLVQHAQQATPVEQLIKFLYTTDKQSCLSVVYILGRKQEWTTIERFIDSLHSTHGYLRAAAIQLLERMRDKTLISLFVSALVDPFMQVRLEAVRAIEGLVEPLPPEATAVIVLLEDEDRKIQSSALRILVRVAEHVSINIPLLEKLLRATQSTFRPIYDPARVCLTKLEQRVTTEQMAILFQHQEPAIRTETMKLWGRYASIEQLSYGLKDEHAQMREAALSALGEHKGDGPLHLITQALNDEDPIVYHKAIRLLENLEEWKLLADLYDEEGLLNLPQVKARRSRDPFEEEMNWDQRKVGRNWLFDTARLMDDHDSSFTTKEGGLHDSVSSIQVEAWKEQYTKDQLINMLHASNRDTRETALLALEEYVMEDQLLIALDDDDCLVRCAAVKVWGERMPIPQLLIALNDEHHLVRKAALQVVKKVVDNLPEEKLVEALHEGNGAMRSSAIQALADHAPVEKLLAALGDSEDEVRIAAIDVLQQTHPEIMPTIIDDLTKVVTEKGPSTFLTSVARSFVTEVIGSLESVPVSLIEEVGKLLDWPYWEVRMKAAQALRELRRNIPDSVIRQLHTLRQDPESQTVRVAANDALAEILSLEEGYEDDVY